MTLMNNLKPSLEGRAPGSRQGAVLEQGSKLQSLLNHQHLMGHRQALPPGRSRQSTFYRPSSGYRATLKRTE